MRLAIAIVCVVGLVAYLVWMVRVGLDIGGAMR
jgi:hypothetical protein